MSLVGTIDRTMMTFSYPVCLPVLDVMGFRSFFVEGDGVALPFFEEVQWNPERATLFIDNASDKPLIAAAPGSRDVLANGAMEHP